MRPNWEAFFTFADDLLCVVAEDGTFVEINHSFSEALGWSREDWIGRHWESLVHPDDQVRSQAYFDELKIQHRLTNVVNRCLRKDGGFLTLSWSAVALFDGGEPLYYASARDVSREVMLAEALHVQTLFLEQTSRVGKIGGWEVDLLRKTGKFTAETHRIYGTDPNTFKPSVEKGLEVYVPEHRPIMATAFQQLVTTGRPYDLELQITNAQGQLLWVRTIGEAQYEGGRIVRVFGTLQDISQEKAMAASRLELEAKVAAQRDFLSKLMDLAPVGICRTDASGLCTSVNRAWSHFTALSAEESFGLGWLTAIHPDDRTQLQQAWLHFVQNSGNFVQEFRFLQKSGSSVWVRAEAIPIHNQEGQVVEFLACIVNMSEQRRIQSELEKASNAKSMFLANVSHEIRTPLNAIIGFSQILADSAVLQKTTHKEDIISIKHSGELLLAIINDVLDISKIEAGNLVMEQRPFRIREAVQHVVDMMRPAAERKNLRLQCNFDPSLPAILVGDELRLKQILINLTGNAVKFTEKGRIQIDIRCQDGENDLLRQVSMVVSDSGIGIPLQHLQHIFKPFSQADSSTTRKFGGTGLGLAISKRLCEMMGGCIQVQSEEGKGSTFTAALQLKIGRLESDATVFGPERLIENYEFLRTLIVEDDPLNRKVAVAALKKYGIKAETCNNGMEAIECCRTVSYDLILMDVQMPVMGGYETTMNIRRSGCSQDAWILAMTANAFEEDRQLCLASGMNDFMSKPIDFRGLQACLNRAAAFTIARHKHEAA